MKQALGANDASDADLEKKRQEVSAEQARAQRRRERLADLQAKTVAAEMGEMHEKQAVQRRRFRETQVDQSSEQNLKDLQRHDDQRREEATAKSRHTRHSLSRERRRKADRRELRSKAAYRARAKERSEKTYAMRLAVVKSASLQSALLLQQQKQRESEAKSREIKENNQKQLALQRRERKRMERDMKSMRAEVNSKNQMRYLQAKQEQLARKDEATRQNLEVSAKQEEHTKILAKRRFVDDKREEQHSKSMAREKFKEQMANDASDEMKHKASMTVGQRLQAVRFAREKLQRLDEKEKEEKELEKQKLIRRREEEHRAKKDEKEALQQKQDQEENAKYESRQVAKAMGDAIQTQENAEKRRTQDELDQREAETQKKRHTFVSKNQELIQKKMQKQLHLLRVDASDIYAHQKIQMDVMDSQTETVQKEIELAIKEKQDELNEFLARKGALVVSNTTEPTPTRSACVSAKDEYELAQQAHQTCVGFHEKLGCPAGPVGHWCRKYIRHLVHQCQHGSEGSECRDRLRQLICAKGVAGKPCRKNERLRKALRLLFQTCSLKKANPAERKEHGKQAELGGNHRFKVVHSRQGGKRGSKQGGHHAIKSSSVCRREGILKVCKSQTDPRKCRHWAHHEHLKYRLRNLIRNKAKTVCHHLNETSHECFRSEKQHFSHSFKQQIEKSCSAADSKSCKTKAIRSILDAQGEEHAEHKGNHTQLVESKNSLANHTKIPKPSCWIPALEQLHKSKREMSLKCRAAGCSYKYRPEKTSHSFKFDHVTRKWINRKKDIPAMHYIGCSCKFLWRKGGWEKQADGSTHHRASQWNKVCGQEKFLTLESLIQRKRKLRSELRDLSSKLSDARQANDAATVAMLTSHVEKLRSDLRSFVLLQNEFAKSDGALASWAGTLKALRAKLQSETIPEVKSRLRSRIRKLEQKIARERRLVRQRARQQRQLFNKKCGEAKKHTISAKTQLEECGGDASCQANTKEFQEKTQKSLEKNCGKPCKYKLRKSRTAVDYKRVDGEWVQQNVDFPEMWYWACPTVWKWVGGYWGKVGNYSFYRSSKYVRVAPSEDPVVKPAVQPQSADLAEYDLPFDFHDNVTFNTPPDFLVPLPKLPKSELMCIHIRKLANVPTARCAEALPAKQALCESDLLRKQQMVKQAQHELCDSMPAEVDLQSSVNSASKLEAANAAESNVESRIKSLEVKITLAGNKDVEKLKQDLLAVQQKAVHIFNHKVDLEAAVWFEHQLANFSLRLAALRSQAASLESQQAAGRNSVSEAIFDSLDQQRHEVKLQIAKLEVKQSKFQALVALEGATNALRQLAVGLPAVNAELKLEELQLNNGHNRHRRCVSDFQQQRLQCITKAMESQSVPEQPEFSKKRKAILSCRKRFVSERKACSNCKSPGGERFCWMHKKKCRRTSRQSYHLCAEAAEKANPMQTPPSPQRVAVRKCKKTQRRKLRTCHRIVSLILAVQEVQARFLLRCQGKNKPICERGRFAIVDVQSSLTPVLASHSTSNFRFAMIQVDPSTNSNNAIVPSSDQSSDSKPSTSDITPQSPECKLANDMFKLGDEDSTAQNMRNSFCKKELQAAGIRITRSPAEAEMQLIAANEKLVAVRSSLQVCLINNGVLGVDQCADMQRAVVEAAQLVEGLQNIAEPGKADQSNLLAWCRKHHVVKVPYTKSVVKRVCGSPRVCLPSVEDNLKCPTGEGVVCSKPDLYQFDLGLGKWCNNANDANADKCHYETVKVQAFHETRVPACVTGNK